MTPTQTVNQTVKQYGETAVSAYKTLNLAVIGAGDLAVERAKVVVSQFVDRFQRFVEIVARLDQRRSPGQTFARLQRQRRRRLVVACPQQMPGQKFGLTRRPVRVQLAQRARRRCVQRSAARRGKPFVDHIAVEHVAEPHRSLGSAQRPLQDLRPIVTDTKLVTCDVQDHQF